jgi:hypothetical protein
MRAYIAIEPGPRRINVCVQAEMSTLWTLLDVIPALNECGRDNREAVEAQLSVLGEELTITQTLTEFSKNHTEPHVLRAAIAAAKWLREGGEAPSIQWLRMVAKKRHSALH